MPRKATNLASVVYDATCLVMMLRALYDATCLVSPSGSHGRHLRFASPFRKFGPGFVFEVQSRNSQACVATMESIVAPRQAAASSRR